MAVPSFSKVFKLSSPQIIRSTAWRSFTSQCYLLQLNQTESHTQRAERTAKRFWKTVSLAEIDDSYGIALDGRHVRTPGGNKLLIPKMQRSLALLVAGEWENQTMALKPNSLILTSLVSRAIDAFQLPTTHLDNLTSDTPVIRAQVINKLLDFMDSDTIVYYEEFPEALVKLQSAHWNPILEWARTNYKTPFSTTSSLLKITQPEETRAKMKKILEQMKSLKLAAFERACLTSKSFLIALALVEKAISVEEAALASHVEVNSQISMWGEVEDSHDVDKYDIRQRLGSVAMVLLEN